MFISELTLKKGNIFSAYLPRGQPTFGHHKFDMMLGLKKRIDN